MPGPKPPSVELTTEERGDLEGPVRRHKTGQQLADRARAADGKNNNEIARELSLEPDTVRLWRQRWLAPAGVASAELGVADRLADAPRTGTPARITPERVASICCVVRWSSCRRKAS